MASDRRVYSTLIISGSVTGTKSISELLPASEFSPIITSKDINTAKRMLISETFDLILINSPLSDETGIEFSVDMAVNTNSGIILIVKSELYYQTAYVVEQYGVLTLSKPVSKQSLYQAVKLSVATRERLRKIEVKNETLKSKMEEIRIVNHAKWLLIECLSMTEQEAHRYIEKQSMDMRLTRREISENIIKTYENR